MTLVLAIAYINVLVGFPESNFKFMHTLVFYRAFNKLFHDPHSASLESLIFIWSPSLWDLMITSFAINKLFTFVRKLMYVFVSFLTAIKNKKQRFAAQGVCFFLQLTIFLPLVLVVLVISTLLETATIPFLGFAFFIIGYPKPLRGWSAITPVSANPNDTRSDGHIYQAMLP